MRATVGCPDCLQRDNRVNGAWKNGDVTNADQAGARGAAIFKGFSVNGSVKIALSTTRTEMRGYVVNDVTLTHLALR
jgi:hypothetical protein